MLRITERVNLSNEELELVGRKDLERNHAALVEACAAFAPKASLAACVERMRADKPEGGTVDGARAQLNQLRQFVLDKKIVTDSETRSRRWWPSRRRTTAEISPTSACPGPYESPTVKATYYVAPPDPKWSAAERNGYLPGKAYLLFVSVHEVWPGHYLQGQFANANPRRSRRCGGTTPSAKDGRTTPRR